MKRRKEIFFIAFITLSLVLGFALCRIGLLFMAWMLEKILEPNALNIVAWSSLFVIYLIPVAYYAIRKNWLYSWISVVAALIALFVFGGIS